MMVNSSLMYKADRSHLVTSECPKIFKKWLSHAINKFVTKLGSNE